MKHLPKTATLEQIEELKQFIQKTGNARTKDRARAILARMQGASRTQLAQFLGSHKDTISNWITKYRKYGIKGLSDKPQHGNKYKLSPQQKSEIKHIVLHNTPRQLGFDHDYWNITLLRELVEKLYRVTFKADKSYQKLYRYIGFDQISK